MSKAKLSSAEWELVKDAPYWVNQALAAADGRAPFLTRRRENKAFEKAIKEYRSGNALIKDILADDSDAAKGIDKASQADAEKALNRIASIVEQKLGGDDMAALKDFLMSIGNTVAASAKERGAGVAVSEKEKAALVNIESALKVSSSFATAHTVAKPSSTTAKPAPAPAKRDDDAKAKKDAEAKERLENARKEAEAKAKAKKDDEAKARLEKARAEAEERQREAKAKAEAAAAEAKAREEAAAATTAAAAPKYTQFIAEHTVAAGDNLSFISERYYGTQANFRIIYEANKDVIGDNMNLIKPGQVLKIPKL